MQQGELEEREARLKVFTVEVVPLRLVSYSEAKAATYAQEEGNGATSGCHAKDVSNHEGVAAETGCFNINLIRASYCGSTVLINPAQVR